MLPYSFQSPVQKIFIAFVIYSKGSSIKNFVRSWPQIMCFEVSIKYVHPKFLNFISPTPFPSKQDPFPNLICIIFATHPTLPKKVIILRFLPEKKYFVDFFSSFPYFPTVMSQLSRAVCEAQCSRRI